MGNYRKSFNETMTSEQALHVYVTLLKQTPKTEWDALRNAYHSADDEILKRDFDRVKEGFMF